MPTTRPTLLCILDGFGLNPDPAGNAVAVAQKPVLDSLFVSCPSTTLITYGERVGLPEGQMGNSEVGHLNIGAGRVVEQWLLRISRVLHGSFLQQSKEWKNFVEATQSSPCLHVVGLYSQGGVHSHAEHLKLLIHRVTQEYRGTVLLHLFTDGRDVAPNAAKEDFSQLKQFLTRYPACKIATIGGRFYGMDRDKRWERVQKAWEAIALGKGVAKKDPIEWIEECYAKGTTDEFIEPAVFVPAGIGSEDAIMFFNFREDRMREIVKALCIDDFKDFDRGSAAHISPKRVLCFTDYDHTYHLSSLFAPIEITNHIGEVISKLGLPQFRAAETEKYPHVTYFFNGGIEKPYPGEERCLVPSPRDVKTYDQKPEMSAFELTAKVTEAIKSKKYKFLVVNFANCDMVGHTGNMNAAVKAVETVDACLGKVLEALKAENGQALIFADHGNAEQMIDYETGAPFTSHTKYPVPLILFGHGSSPVLAHGGALCDIAPTTLKLMGIEQPAEMTGKSLIE